ncbi:MAG: hemerythrin family protein [Spirochaetia bacterium]|nr:hemerythrin family protein [Spirochaetia bacterium]
MSIEWNARYAIGVPQIDEQHKELIEKFSNYMKVCAKGNQQDEIVKMLTFLEKYVEKHFNDEEELQTQIKYPKFQQHLNAHMEYKAKIKKLKTEIENEHLSITTIITTNKEILRWIINHIGKMDNEIAEYIKQNNIKV